MDNTSKPNELHFSDMKQVAAFLKGCDKKQSFKIIMPGSSLNGLRISYNDGSWGVWFGPAVFMDIYGMDDKGDITLI